MSAPLPLPGSNFRTVPAHALTPKRRAVDDLLDDTASPAALALASRNGMNAGDRELIRIAVTRLLQTAGASMPGFSQKRLILVLASAQAAFDLDHVAQLPAYWAAMRTEMAAIELAIIFGRGVGSLSKSIEAARETVTGYHGDAIHWLDGDTHGCDQVAALSSVGDIVTAQALAEAMRATTGTQHGDAKLAASLRHRHSPALAIETYMDMAMADTASAAVLNSVAASCRETGRPELARWLVSRSVVLAPDIYSARTILKIGQQCGPPELEEQARQFLAYVEGGASAAQLQAWATCLAAIAGHRAEAELGLIQLARLVGPASVQTVRDRVDALGIAANR